MSRTITVGIADLNASRAPDVLVTYALGSCVGICLLDSLAQVGGLAHIMLPDSKMISNAQNSSRKFADTGIDELLSTMIRCGARPGMIKAKIAGGAQMFAAMSNSSIANIGERNVVAVKEVLRRRNIPILAEDTGKNYGRTLYFHIDTGVMQIKSGNRGEWNW